MSEVATSPKPKKPVYQMPKIDPGDVVMVLSSQDDPSPGYLAMVTQLNFGSINVVQLGGRARQIDALRYKDDPWHRENPEEPHNCWSECQKTIRLAEIERMLADLAAEIGSIKAMLKGRSKSD